MARRKFGEFSEEELTFLYKKVEKNRHLKEKTRIDLSITEMVMPDYDNSNLDRKKLNDLKFKIIDSLLNCTYFQFTEYLELVIYDSEDESDREYRHKLNLIGLEF